MDATQPENVFNQLQEGYQEEIALYEKLLELSRQQLALLGGEDNEKASGIVKEKEEVISAIRKIEERLNPSREAWPRVESQLPEEQRQALESIVENVRRLIRKVLEQDEDSVELLKKNSESMREKMQKIRQNKAAAQAYQNQKNKGAEGEDGPMFLDKME